MGTACAFSSAAALFGTSVGITGSAVGTGLSLQGLVGGSTVGSAALITGSGLLVGAGILGLKAIAVSSVLANRSKRSDDETDLAFVPIAVSEPEACYKRFICDLATGAMS